MALEMMEGEVFECWDLWLEGEKKREEKRKEPHSSLQPLSARQCLSHASSLPPSPTTTTLRFLCCRLQHWKHTFLSARRLCRSAAAACLPAARTRKRFILAGRCGVRAGRGGAPALPARSAALPLLKHLPLGRRAPCLPSTTAHRARDALYFGKSATYSPMPYALIAYGVTAETGAKGRLCVCVVVDGGTEHGACFCFKILEWKWNSSWSSCHVPLSQGEASQEEQACWG